MANGNDITLKLGVDINDAENSMKQFGAIAEKAMKSSDTASQKWGATLGKLTDKMSANINKMREMQGTQVKTDQWYELDKQIKQVNSELIKSQSNLTKLQKNPVKTSEYQQWENSLSQANSKLKEAQATLNSFDKKSAWTDEFRGATAELSKWQTKLDSAKAKLETLKVKGVTGDEFDRAQNSVDLYKNKVDSIKATMDRLELSGKKYADNNGFSQAQQNVATYTTEVNAAETALTNLEAQNKKWDTTAIDNEKTHIQDLTNNVDELKAAQSQAYVPAESTDEYRQLGNNVAYAQQKAQYMSNSIYTAASSANKMNNNLGKSRSTLDTVRNKVSGLISRLKALGNQSNSTSTRHNTSFKKMLTTVLKYGFGIRSIFLLYRKLRATISTGLTEMSKQFTDVADDVYTLKNSWSGFKSSLVSAFQPIFSYVVPALSTLINYLTTAMNALANFFALLTGSSTYKKAVAGNESVADSVSGTGSAAEEANEELAEYDDLIVIDQDSSSGGSGGGGSSDSDAWNWEEVEVTSSSLADKLSDIWDVFKSAWETKGEDVINAAEYALSSLKSLASTIGDTFYRVFTEGYGYDWLVSCLGVVEQLLLTIGDVATAIEEAWERNDNGYNLVVSIFEMWTAINDMIITVQESWREAWNSGTGVDIVEDILQSVTNINNTIKNFAENFTTAWEKAGVGDSIMQTILDIVESITDFINDITEATEEWSESLDFYPLLESIDTILGSIKGIIDSIKTIAYYIYTNIILPISKKILESTLPDFIEEVADFIDEVKDNLDDIDWDSLTESIGTIIDLALDVFLEGVKTALDDLKPLIPIIKEEFKALSTVLDFLTDEDTIEYFESLRDKINEIKSLLGMKSDKFSILDSTTVGNVLTKITNLYNFIVKIKELITGEAWSTWGKDIRDGLLEDFANADTIEEKVRAFFKAVIAALKKVFGINSPAKEMYVYGEDILKGILTGFKNAFTNIATTIRELKDKIVNKIKEKFKNFNLSDIVTGLGSVAMTISTAFTGAITKFADFSSLDDTLSNIKTKYKNMKAKLTTTLSGAVQKIKGTASNTLETLSTTWSNLKKNWSNAKATLSAYVGGQMSGSSDISNWTSLYSSLKNSWTSTSATVSAYVGGQLSNIKDINGNKGSWTEVYTDFKNNTWTDATATVKANADVGGKSDPNLSRMSTNGDWTTTFTNFAKNVWKGTTATFNSEYKNSDTNSTGYKNFKSVYDKWTGRNASFTSTYQGSTSDAGYKKFSSLWSNWYGRTAKFTAEFEGTTSVTSVANTALEKVYNALEKNGYKVTKKVWAAKGGVITGLTNLTDIMTGEAGAEAIVPLERNLGWLDKMAGMITDRLVETPIPLIANGNILPITDAFMKSTIEVMDNSKIAQLLESILDRLDNLESSNNAPIMLQLDGRTVAEVVWDETEKRYRQTGKVYSFA